MKAVIVVDNIGTKELQGEWGLSVYIEYNDKKILLDVGASPLFYDNLKKMGLEITDIDYAVLSHAHYDHSKGMKTFFEKNKKAKFYVSNNCQENCYFKKWILHKYIGIPKGILTEYKERFEYAKGDYMLAEGIYLIPHHTKGLEIIGKRENMYLRDGRNWKPDDFSHEQSLVFDTAKGLVIFNSCSHGGADNVINEVSKSFPGKNIYALIGGFHLYNKSEEEVRALSKRIKETGIKKVYTGHCTGDKAFRFMKEELGDSLKQLCVNLKMDF